MDSDGALCELWGAEEKLILALLETSKQIQYVDLHFLFVCIPETFESLSLKRDLFFKDKDCLLCGYWTLLFRNSFMRCFILWPYSQETNLSTAGEHIRLANMKG